MKKLATAAVLVWASNLSAVWAAPGGFEAGALPAAPGLGLAHNLDQEPGVAVAPDGTFWIAASIGASDPRGMGPLAFGQNPPALSGSDVWRSTDGGQTYQWVAAPLGLLAHKNGLGGGDTDIAVATQRNRSGFYNLYVAGLPGVVAAGQIVTDVSMAVSRDGGRTWLLDPSAATVPIDDRQWLATDGACTVYLTYHSLPTSATTVNKYDFCSPLDTIPGLSAVTLASTRYVHLLPRLVLNMPDTYVLAGQGKPVVDTSILSPYQHRVYIPALDCPNLQLQAELQRGISTDPTCPTGVRAHAYVEVSPDGGRTWTLHDVAASTNNRVPTWPSIATDANGTAYLAWSDDRDVYLSMSRDGGADWTPPAIVNAAPSATAIMPVVAAAGPGVVDIAWYGTTVAGLADDAAAMGTPGGPTSAPWSVYLARSTDGGDLFTQTVASNLVHTGQVCVLGTLCNISSGERDLFDDFGMGISPTSSALSIAYTSDEPQGDIAHACTVYSTTTR